MTAVDPAGALMIEDDRAPFSHVVHALGLE
jgi:hypothetical protein